MELVLAALVTAVPATLGSLAAWRNSSVTRKQVQSPNGKTTGAAVEEIHTMLRDHIGDPNAHQRPREDSVTFERLLGHRGPQ